MTAPRTRQAIKESYKKYLNRDDAEDGNEDVDIHSNTDNEDEYTEDMEDEPSIAPLGERKSMPFPAQGQKIFDSTDFDIFVQNVKEKKSHKYEMEDHVYNIRVRKKKDVQLLLDNLYDGIRDFVIFVLKKLQNVYDKEKNHQISAAIYGKGFPEGSINTSNFSLNTNPTRMADVLMGFFAVMLRSNENAELDPSFRVAVKVMSNRHVNDLNSRRPDWHIHNPVA